MAGDDRALISRNAISNTDQGRPTVAERHQIQAIAPSVSAEARIKQLAATAHGLRFVLSTKRARESGSINGLMQVLNKLGDA